MKFVGVDLHKETISLCVVNQKRIVLERARLRCRDENSVQAFFQKLGACQVVVEATASYEWFVRLVEPLAEKVLLAHPKKLRVIAESTRKSDKLDAQVLAEFLALDMIPTSYRPTPRQRDHRRLVRQRDMVQRRITSVKNRLRRIMANYNADRRDLFSQVGQQALQEFECSSADRFAIDQLTAEFQFFHGQLLEADGRLREFAKTAPVRERQLRELLHTIPGVGFVTAEVVLAEIADIDRFETPAVDPRGSGLATGPALAAMVQHLSAIEKTAAGEEGHRRRGPATAGPDHRDPEIGHPLLRDPPGRLTTKSKAETQKDKNSQHQTHSNGNVRTPPRRARRAEPLFDSR